MSMDWGACGEGDPFSIGWWAVSDGTDEDGTIPYFRRGTRIRYREWYGAGLDKVDIDQVSDGIKEREQKDPKITYRVAGGDIKKKLEAKGPSIFEMFADNGIHFVRADMSRVAGWLKLRRDLRGKDEIPDVYMFDTCHDSIEIMPAVQHSKQDANDIEASNDHIPDEWRYAAMARPWATTKPPSEIPFEQKFKPPTIDDLWAEHSALVRSSRR